jgi:hypothetical protein
MDARSELLAYMGSAVVTVVVLFGMQIWYATYLDTHVVNVHPADAPTDAKREAFDAQERAKLSSGKKPIAQVKAELAQRGRTAFPSVAPKASEDLSPMAGWMRRPGFKPYVPRTAVPAAATTEAASPTDSAAQPAAAEQGGTAQVAAADGAAAAATGAPAAPPARAPARRVERAPAPVVQGTPAAPPAAGH